MSQSEEVRDVVTACPAPATAPPERIARDWDPLNAPRWARLAWLPVPVALVALAALIYADPRTPYDSRVLLLALNFTFSTLTSWFVAFLLARSYLVRRTPGLLLTTAGILLYGITNSASTAIGGNNVNTMVTIHNIGVLIAAVCHFAGALIALASPGRSIRSAGLWLGVAVCSVIAAMALIGGLGTAGVLPAFFIQGHGGTPVRQAVLAGSISLFVLTAAILRAAHRNRISPFLHWYTLALLLIALGIWGVMFQSSFGSSLNWTARGVQYLGGLYLLFAALASVRDADAWGISLEAELDRARRRYKDLLSLAVDAVLVYEFAAGAILEANPAACTMLGYSPEELANRTFAGLLEPEESGAVSRETEALVRNGFLRHEKTLLARDGRAIPVEITSRLFTEAGVPMVMSIVRNVTERKRIEEELRRRLEELQTVMDAAPVAIWVSRDPACDTIVGNRAADRFYEAGDGENVSANVSPVRRFFRGGQELPASELPMQKAAALNADVRDEALEVELPSGRRIFLAGSGSPLRDASGNVRGCVGAFIDITDRRNAELALQEREERLRLALDAGKLGTWDWNLAAGAMIWNSEFERMLGYEPGESRAGYEAWLSRVHPEDRQRLEQAISHVLEHGSELSVQYRALWPDGTVRWLEALGRAVPGPDGRISRHYGVVIDITGRKRSEARIRHVNSILEARNRLLRDSMRCVTDQELGRVCVALAEQLTGSASGFVVEVNAGRLFTSHAGSGQEPPAGFDVDALCARVLAGGKSFFTNSLHAGPDGAAPPPAYPALQSFLGVPLLNEGKTIGMIGVANRPGGYAIEHAEALEGLALEFVHMLLLKRAERAVRAGEERLRQAQKAESIGLLAGGIAHDFNNLLVGILGNANLAEEMLPHGSPAAGLLKRITKAGEQAAHLTRQMLAYAGKGRFVLEPVDLSAVVSGGSALVKSGLSRKITFTTRLSPRLPAVKSDPSQMQQIFMNLVINAGEAIGAEAGEIVASTGSARLTREFIEQELPEWDVEPGEFVYLQVSDTGCGMDPATKARIFDPFFTTKFQGRGLGLAAVAGIVRAHRGAIWVTTEKGTGSTFRVLLPASAESVPPPPPSTERTGDLRGKGTVLVVDDEQMVLQVAGAALEKQGYRVLPAGGGPAAVDLMRAHPDEIVLVVLDLSMPGMGGDRVLPLLRAVKPDVPVIVSSGFSETETLRAFNGAPVNGFLQKPYTVTRLAAEVKSVLS